MKRLKNAYNINKLTLDNATKYNYSKYAQIRRERDSRQILNSLQATRWEHSQYTYVHAFNTRIHTRIHIRLAVIRACGACVARKVAQCCIANCITCTHIACIAHRSLALSLSTFHSNLSFLLPSPLPPLSLSLSLSLSPSFSIIHIYSFLSSNLLFTLIFCHRPPCVILHFRCCAHFLRGFLSYFVLLFLLF